MEVKANPATLDVLPMSERISLIAEPVWMCHKGHAPCWKVTLTVAFPAGGQTRRRVEGPYEHMTLIGALDIVSVVSAHYGSALELQEQKRILEKYQLSLDVQREQ